MAREWYETDDDARGELIKKRAKPEWRTQRHILPFNELSPDEFEILCFLLLRREHPDEQIIYYGKTGDAGRDIIRRAKNGMHLVQCKRFGGNVGIGEVRAELAKLYTNLHSETIPEKPKLVSFYTSQDLTAPAQDLLDSQSSWTKVAESAIADHLKRPPAPELLDFARSWWPIFERENGAALTERLKLHGDLLEEFFSLQKVVDTQAIVPLASGIEEANRKLDLSLRMQGADAFEKMRLLVEAAEAQNPGVAITADTTASGTGFRIAAREGAGPVCAGRLSFPNDDSGRTGRAKFEQLRETGRAIELLPGECLWEPELPLLAERARDRSVTLRINPQRPGLKIAVRLDCHDDSSVVSALPFAHLSVVRFGSKELEFEVRADRQAVALTFLLKSDGLSNLHYDVSFTGLRVEDALKGGRFVLSLSGSHPRTLTIWSLEEDCRLLEVGGVRLDAPENIQDSILFLESLELINRTLGTDFKHPAEIDPIDEKRAAILAAGIKGLDVADSAPRLGPLKFPKHYVSELATKWKATEPCDVSFTSGDSWSLLGTSVDVGTVAVTLCNAMPVEAVDDLVTRLATVANDEPVSIQLGCKRIVFQFLRWAPPIDV